MARNDHLEGSGADDVKTLDSCVGRIQEIVETCKSIRDDVILLCHGGPIAMPEDASYILQRVEGLDGFYGASSTERFPTEVAIKKQIEDFKRIRLPKA
jgi:predicted TIM-barrel enzyme